MRVDYCNLIIKVGIEKVPWNDEKGIENHVLDDTIGDIDMDFEKEKDGEIQIRSVSKL